MSNRIQILAVTLGDEHVASSRVRVYAHQPRLRRAGIRCRILPLIWGEAVRTVYRGERRRFDGGRLGTADGGLRIPLVPCQRTGCGERMLDVDDA